MAPAMGEPMSTPKEPTKKAIPIRVPTSAIDGLNVIIIAGGKAMSPPEKKE